MNLTRRHIILASLLAAAYVMLIVSLVTGIMAQKPESILFPAAGIVLTLVFTYFLIREIQNRTPPSPDIAEFRHWAVVGGLAGMLLMFIIVIGFPLWLGVSHRTAEYVGVLMGLLVFGSSLTLWTVRRPRGH